MFVLQCDVSFVLKHSSLDDDNDIDVWCLLFYGTWYTMDYTTQQTVCTHLEQHSSTQQRVTAYTTFIYI